MYLFEGSAKMGFSIKVPIALSLKMSLSIMKKLVNAFF